MSPTPASTPSPSAGLPRLIGVAVAVFLLTFSLVPLYRIACEKVFGVRLERGPGSEASVGAATAKRTGMSRFSPACSVCAVKQKHSVLLKNPEARAGATEGTALPTIACGPSLRA